MSVDRAASFISETAVTILQESGVDGSRKSMVFLRRTQMPPPLTLRLQEEWSLEPYGLCGSWGYMFRYQTGELCLYQRSEGDTPGDLLDLATLSSNDWGV